MQLQSRPLCCGTLLTPALALAIDQDVLLWAAVVSVPLAGIAARNAMRQDRRAEKADRRASEQAIWAKNADRRASLQAVWAGNEERRAQRRFQHEEEALLAAVTASDGRRHLRIQARSNLL